MENYRSKRETIEQFMLLIADVNISEPITVGDVMTAEPECLSIHVTALDLVKRFHATGFRHMLLADDQHRLVGIVSDRDVTRCFSIGSNPSSEELQQIRATDLMSTDLITVASTTPLDQVVSLLVEEGISSVPVVDDSQLVGILTNTDLNILLHSLLAVSRHHHDLADMAAALA